MLGTRGGKKPSLQKGARPSWDWRGESGNTGRVLGWTLSSVVIRAPSETSAGVQDTAPSSGERSIVSELSQTCEHQPHSLTLPLPSHRPLDWRAGWGLVGKGL